MNDEKKSPPAGQRKMPLRQAAEKIGRSERTLQRWFSHPRTEYLQSAQARQDRAGELRAKGLRWKEVGEAMGISPAAAKQLVYRSTQKKSAST